MLRAAERLDPGDTLFSYQLARVSHCLRKPLANHRFEGGLTICVVQLLALDDQERQLKEFCQ